MRSRALLNTGLAVAVAALALVAWFEPGRDPAPEPIPLAEVDPSSVRALRIEPRGAPPIVLARTGEGWTMRAPHALPANAWRVQALLGVLSATSVRGFRAAGNDLSRFGLDPPRVRLVADGIAIDLGDTDPLDARRYVRAGDQVHLIEDGYSRHLEDGAAGLVHASPLGPGADPVEIDVPALHVVMEDAGWSVRRGTAPANADAMNALADAWRHASALAVRATGARSPPEAIARVRLRGAGSPIALEVGRTDTEIVFTRPDLGLRYHFVRRSGERLLAVEPD